MNKEITDMERAALEVLRSTGVDVLEAALVAREALECGRGRVRRARECVRLGAEEMRKREKTVTFSKARAIMSGVFSTAIKHDWCDSNPVSRVEVPDVVEKPIEPLTIEAVERLEAAAQLPEHQAMQLSLHLMLYCGIRPTEVSRIDPERDIDWQDQRVVVRPTTSKTGGGRVVPLRCGNIDALRHDIPRRRVQRWRALRKAAGWSKETAHPWRQDVCRHTFATYHAAHFRNFAALQLEMGHRDSSLLRTRYVYAGKTNEASARSYFECTKYNVQSTNWE